MKYLEILLLVALAMSASSCGTVKFARQLAEHQSLLTNIAQNKAASSEEKFDVLAGSLVEMMNQALKFTSPTKGKKYVQAYFKENNKAIFGILDEVITEQSKLSSIERIGNGVKLTQKPYAKDFIKLFPKFAKKYQQIKFVNDFGKKLKKTVFGSLNNIQFDFGK
ncbi:MAG: hypothetical protein R2798_09195 [Chitinophagales bacterium]|nr:hypothetical protein [Bacteroidota bacterium]